MLVVRSPRMVMLIELADETAALVLESFKVKPHRIAEPMSQTLTCNLGREIGRHVKLNANTRVVVYFCDPNSALQRGSFENTNKRSSSTCPRARTCSSTAWSSSMPLPTAQQPPISLPQLLPADRRLPSHAGCDRKAQSKIFFNSITAVGFDAWRRYAKREPKVTAKENTLTSSKRHIR